MDYYQTVVSVAQMENAPRLSWKQLLKSLRRITDAMGVTVDEEKLKAAWREFSAAPAQRIAYA